MEQENPLPPSLVFLNADAIAKELKAQGTTRADIEAGRRLVARMDELKRQQSDFAIETTLSNRALAKRIQRLQEKGYRFTLLFFWLSSADLAVRRVAGRVQRGGHDIPEATIRRRYKTSLSHFFNRYRSLADVWRMYDNSHFGTPQLIATGRVRISTGGLEKAGK